MNCRPARCRRAMNFEVDELLDHVDEWKFKLHEKLKNLT
jgi:hypothetical protein